MMPALIAARRQIMIDPVYISSSLSTSGGGTGASSRLGLS
jgi:hypothetical protein